MLADDARNDYGGFFSGCFARDGVEVMYPTEGTTHHYAALHRQLREQGTPIPTNDLR